MGLRIIRDPFVFFVFFFWPFVFFCILSLALGSSVLGSFNQGLFFSNALSKVSTFVLLSK